MYVPAHLDHPRLLPIFTQFSNQQDRRREKERGHFQKQCRKKINLKILPFVVIILLLILLVVPGPVVAQGPIDLVFGSSGSIPWNESGIEPGSHGSTSIDLINNGTLAGTLYIWVDNISQTDAFGDGAALGKYMYFSITHPNLVSTIPLPSRIDAFPTAPWNASYLVISPVRSGEVVTLNWTWEFVRMGQVQNDAQGDSLRFNISFMLVNETFELPTPTVTTTPLVISASQHQVGSSSGGTQSSPNQSPVNSSPTEEITPVTNGTLVPTPLIGKSVPGVSDHRYIMFIGFFVLLISFIINSQGKTHPTWVFPAQILWTLGIIITLTGILYEVYSISPIQGQHFGSLHSIIGVVATLVIIFGLVWWSIQEKTLENHKGHYVWVLLLGITLLFVALVLGFTFVPVFH